MDTQEFTDSDLTFKDEIDRMNMQLPCNHCRKPRTLVKSVSNHNRIRVCQNKECFHYTDLSQVNTWKKVSKK